MKIIDHNAEGATFHLDQRELLMVMALVQEGRDSFECEGQTGQALEQLFNSAVVWVEDARRLELKKLGLALRMEQAVQAHNDGGQDLPRTGSTG